MLRASYTFTPTVRLTATQIEHLRSFPGFRWSDRKGTLRAPYSAGWLASQVFQAWGVPVSITHPSVKQPRPWSDDAAFEFRARLHDSRIYSWLGDGVGGPWQLLPFQREAIWFALERDGGFMVEPAGCLAGDTEVIANRAGKGFRMSLKEVVIRFNGGRGLVRDRAGKLHRKGKRWDLTIPTYVQGVGAGELGRKLRLLRAIKSGVKPVFEVKAGGRTLRATADHQFRTPNGWKRLSELDLGDAVWMLERPQGPRVLWRPVAYPIESIETAGEEETFDLTVEGPHHNFSANGFVVHNSGKTVQGVCWAELDPLEGGVLVVTKSGVVRQFTRAVEQFVQTTALALRPPSELPIRGGVRMQPREVLDEYLLARREAGERPYIVVGWGSLRTYVPVLLGYQWRSIIYDECQFARQWRRLKWTMDHDTGGMDYTVIDNMSAAAWQIAQYVPRRLAMTATPIPDRRRGLWGQLTLVEPNGWGLTGTKFFARYCDAHAGEYGGLDNKGTSNTEELTARLSFSMHRVPREVTHAQLPPVRLQTYYVPRERQDRTSGFKRALKKLAKEAQTQKSKKAELDELHLQEAAARKRSAILEVLGEHFGGSVDGLGKVILFTGRHRDCWELCERIDKKWPDVTVFRGVKKKDKRYSLPNMDERQGIQDAYMAHPGPCVLIGTGKAWGTGLDLQDTDLLGLVMLPYEPGELVQWLGRVNRLGQKRPCTVMMFIATGTVDERVAYILAEKTPDIEAVIGDAELADARRSLQGLDDIEAVIDRVVEKAGRDAEQSWDDEETWQAALHSAVQSTIT